MHVIKNYLARWSADFMEAIWFFTPIQRKNNLWWNTGALCARVCVSGKCLCVCDIVKRGGGGARSHVTVITLVFLRSIGKAEFGILFDAGASVETLKLDLMTSPPHTRASTGSIACPWCPVSANLKPYLHHNPCKYWKEEKKNPNNHGFKIFPRRILRLFSFSLRARGSIWAL